MTTSNTIKALLTEKNKEDIYINGGDCLTCLYNPSNIITQPCGHCVTCSECIKENNNCVLCGANIVKIQEIHGIDKDKENKSDNISVSSELGTIHTYKTAIC